MREEHYGGSGKITDTRIQNKLYGPGILRLKRQIGHPPKKSKSIIIMRVLLETTESYLTYVATSIESLVAVKYNFKIIYIRFIGTHKQYDKINAKEI